MSKKPNCDSKPGSSRSFREITPPLSEGVLEYLDSKGFHAMTPVQESTIPLFLQNKDVAVQAVTGSGKTLAFLLPLVERLRERKFSRNQIGGLVLSPTRELAIQTWRVCKELCEAVSLPPPLLLVGGGTTAGKASSYRPVTEDLKTFQQVGSDIAICTPGRLEDVLSRYKLIDTSELEMLILDEADVLLFGKSYLDPTVASILSKLPKMRRTGIFSATTTFSQEKNIKTLLQRAGMRNPVLINVEVAASRPVSMESNTKEDQKQSFTPTSLTNYYMITETDEKVSRMVAFLMQHREEKIIVFFLTCACVNFYGETLIQAMKNHNINIELLHGKLAQKRRENAMERYRAASSGVLFCTDVAARGVDVEKVDWVVQLDAPQNPSQFVHRVGRSARAGKKGSSLLFLTKKEEAYLDLLANRQVSLLPLSQEERCHLSIDDTPLDFSQDHNPNVLPLIRDLVMKDRDILEKGTKAFTSYIRAYKEHTCAFIFRFASLDLGKLATSFCLLRLPKMPELRDAKGGLKHFEPASKDVNIFAIPYLDKAREAARQRRLEAENKNGGKSAKHLKAEEKKADILRKQKERRKVAIEKGRNPDKKRGRHQQLLDEWDDLAREERLFKKLRQGKISKEEYRKLTGASTSTSTST